MKCGSLRQLRLPSPSAMEERFREFLVNFSEGLKLNFIRKWFPYLLELR